MLIVTRERGGMPVAGPQRIFSLNRFSLFPR